MKKVVVLGGGFGGLAAASFLASSGYSVEVIEASGKAGGRAYSFLDKDSNTIIDNGQHILMGCYKETLKFINLIGAGNNFTFQKQLKVNFVKENLQLYPLHAKSFFYPLNLLFGLLTYRAISFKERLLLLKVFLKLHLYSSKDLEKMNVDEWLTNEGQTEKIKKSFWEILAVGALNTNIKNASAKMFADILKQIFFRGNIAATIVLPSQGLSESYCYDAISFIQNRKGKINFNEQVILLGSDGRKITSIKTTKRTLTDFDYIISALPLYALDKILPQNSKINLPQLEYSSILSAHIWLKVNNLAEEFYGLINSPVHWLFNHKDHITLVISDANYFNNKSREELFEMFIIELDKYFGIKQDDIISYKIIKEKRATFIPSNDILKSRPPTDTEYKNLYLAGDWVNSGLPSTIESAVKSGVMAVNAIKKLHN